MDQQVNICAECGVGYERDTGTAISETSLCFWCAELSAAQAPAKEAAYRRRKKRRRILALFFWALMFAALAAWLTYGP